MIQLIEAPPRSGKTYFAVNYLCKFTSYDDLYNEYILDSSVLIISNIEGLRIAHWSLAECLKKQSLQEFFTIENFEKIMEKTGKTRVIIAIDEVHELFPVGMKDQALYNFFAYHGHIGLDIILMTQSLDATTRMFNPLLEFIVKVTPRSRAVLNTFSYSYVTTKGTQLYTKSLAKKKMVFNAYKSFRKDEHAKPKNAVKHWIIVICVLILSAVFLFKSALAIVKDKSEVGNKAVSSADRKARSGVVIPIPGAVVAPVAASTRSADLPLPPAFKKYSSPAVAAPSSLYVAGFADNGTVRKYLLSNGRIVDSKVKLVMYQTYNP